METVLLPHPQALEVIYQPRPEYKGLSSPPALAVSSLQASWPGGLSRRDVEGSSTCRMLVGTAHGEGAQAEIPHFLFQPGKRKQEKQHQKLALLPWSLLSAPSKTLPHSTAIIAS